MCKTPRHSWELSVKKSKGFKWVYLTIYDCNLIGLFWIQILKVRSSNLQFLGTHSNKQEARTISWYRWPCEDLKTGHNYLLLVLPMRGQFNLYKSEYILPNDDLCQVWFHLVEQLYIRRRCLKMWNRCAPEAALSTW